MMADLFGIIQTFQFLGSFMDVSSFGGGHINDTYLTRFLQADGSTRRYILQRINSNVFKQPEQVMANIEKVTSHLCRKVVAAGGDPMREALNLVLTQDGRSFYRDQAGDYWRSYLFIEGANTFESAESLKHVYSAAWAFGHFQCQLADFPVDQLYETIPNFHNTPMRYQAFIEAVERDSAQRAAEVQDEIHFIQQREPDTRVPIDLLEQGILPLRVTHNDTKFSNVMIDVHSGRSICIIDLDTVMPGLALYDFGDAVRSAAALSAEDEPDRCRAGFSLEVFDRLAHGYLDATRGFLTEKEFDYLAFSARVITLEQAIRFLADYLNGDRYYKVHRPGQNLDRARTQIKMLQDMESHFAEMQMIVSKYR